MAKDKRWLSKRLQLDKPGVIGIIACVTKVGLHHERDEADDVAPQGKKIVKAHR